MVLFIIIYPLMMFALGDLSLGALGLKRTLPGSFTCGFTASLALFQLIAYPLHVMRASFSALFAIYGILLAALIILSAVLMARRGAIRGYLRGLRGFFSRLSSSRAFAVLFALVLILQFAFALLIRHDNGDDGFYMARSLETLESGKLNLENSLYATGYAYNSFRLTSDASTFEYYRAFFSALFGAHVSILSHTAMQIVYSVFAYFAVYSLGSRLVGRETKKLLPFLFFFAGIMLFANLGGNTEPFYFVRYEWHGKALVASVVAPAVMSLCYDIISADSRGEKIPAGLWVGCSGCLLAGISLSTVGIMLPPVIYVACGLPYILHRISRVRKLMLPAVLSLAPVALFGVLQYTARLSDNVSLADQSDAFASEQNIALFALTGGDISYWTDMFRWQMLSTGVIVPVLFAAGLIYVMIKAKGAAKYILGGSSLFILLTLLNPIFAEEVRSYLTTEHVYYRLYWILPSFYVTAYALGDVFGPVVSAFFIALRSPEKRRRVPARVMAALFAVLCCGAVYLAVSAFGSDDYADELRVRVVGSESSSNLYRIPQAAIDLCEYMLDNRKDGEEPKILCYGEIEPYLRQYSSEIVLVTDNRHISERVNLFPGTDVDVCDFVRRFYGGEVKDGAYADGLLRGFGVDYVLIPDGFELPDGCGLEKIKDVNGYGELEGYSLYSYKDHQ